MPWLVLEYAPIATFELRPSNTTKTGGKTLLCPTPYTIKMALLDRMIRYYGLDYGREAFPALRDLAVWLRPPAAVAINRTFQKILRPPFKNGAWTSTIAMREFCVQAGTLGIALGMPEARAAWLPELTAMATAINYFGQRGSFYQLEGGEERQAPPVSYVDATAPTQTRLMGFLQRMDDMQPEATFDDVSAFNPRSKGGRMAYNVVFPYRLVANASNHTVWRWSEVSE